MKSTFTFTLFIMFLTLFCSCEKSEEPGPPDEAYEAIKGDFNSRHSGVTINKKYGAGGTYYVEYTDKEGFSCKTIYNEGEFQLDMKLYKIDNLLAQLPDTVRITFESLGYQNIVAKVAAENYRFAEISRRGFKHKYYDFVFLEKVSDLAYSTSYVLIDEDGYLLRNNGNGNYQERVFWETDEILDTLDSRFPGCDVRAFSYDGGEYQFILNQNQKRITAVFDKSGVDGLFTWKYAIYENLQVEDVPAYVWERYEEELSLSANSDFELDNIYYKDEDIVCQSGKCYCFVDKIHGKTIYIYIG